MYVGITLSTMYIGITLSTMYIGITLSTMYVGITLSTMYVGITLSTMYVGIALCPRSTLALHCPRCTLALHCPRCTLALHYVHEVRWHYIVHDVRWHCIMSTIMVRGTTVNVFTKSFCSQPVSVFWYEAFKITVLHVLYNISVNLKVRYNINIARHIVPESHFQSCDRKGESVVVKNSFLCSIAVTIFHNNTALIRNIISFSAILLFLF